MGKNIGRSLVRYVFFNFLRNLGATYVIYLEYGFEILQAEIKLYYPTLIFLNRTLERFRIWT